MFYLQSNCALSLFNKQEMCALAGSSVAELVALLAGGSNKPPGWAATCTISVVQEQERQTAVFYPAGAERNPWEALLCSLSSHIRAVQPFVMVLHGLNERPVTGSPGKADATLKSSQLKPESPDSSSHIVP